MSEPIKPQKPNLAGLSNTPTKTVRINVEENDAIPPSGLFVSLNGRAYLIQPGKNVDVPVGVVEILENAIYDAPQVDPSTGRVVGTSSRLRFPFRLVRKVAATED
jgi:hypothetical protein